GGECGVRRNPADALEVHGGQRRSGVEAVPPEPEDDTADRGNRHVVAGWHAAAVALELPADARPKDDGTRKSDEATDRVDYRRPREAAERRGPRREPADGTPHPMAEDRVDEAAHHDPVDEAAAEGGTTDHRTRGDRAARVGERVLEEEKREERDAGRAVR